MPIEYHYWECQICKRNYATEKEAKRCERQPPYLRRGGYPPGMIWGVPNQILNDKDFEPSHWIVTDRIEKNRKDWGNPHFLAQICYGQPTQYDDGFENRFDFDEPLNMNHRAYTGLICFADAVSYVLENKWNPTYWDGKKIVNVPQSLINSILNLD